MKSHDVLMSSSRQDWETPQSMYAFLNAEFNFDLDVAAHELNHKHDTFLTEDDDALSLETWPGVRPFCNPPYGRTLGRWVRKFSEMRTRVEHLVTLITARTDTAWFHDYVLPFADEVRLVRGRILFEVDGKPVQHQDKKTQEWRDSAATFPSAIVVWRPEPLHRTSGGPLIISCAQEWKPAIAKKKKRK